MQGPAHPVESLVSAICRVRTAPEARPRRRAERPASSSPRRGASCVGGLALASLLLLSTLAHRAQAAEPEPIAASGAEQVEGAAAPEEPVDPLAGARGRRHMLHSAWAGPVGGFRVIDAGSAATGTFRVMLGGRGSVTEGWLEPGVSNTELDGVISFAWTPLEFLEIHASSTAWKDSDYELSSRQIQVYGSTTVGAKAFVAPAPWLYVGGDLAFRLPLNTLSDTSRVFEAFSFGPRANVSVDLRELEGREGRVPLIARFSVGYWFDNSGALVEGVERDRYAELPTEGPDARRPYDAELRHRLTRAERYATRIDRADHIPLGIGIEVPIELPSIRSSVSPIAELVVDVPVRRQGFPCTPGPTVAEGDGCLESRGLAAARRRLVLGSRFSPGLRHLSLFGALELGLGGVDTHVQELAPEAPYSVLFGLSYAYDPQSAVKLTK